MQKGPFPPDPTRPLASEPELPVIDRPLVVLADASSTFERQIITAWVERHRGGRPVDVISLAPSRRRSPRKRTDARLSARLQRGDDPWVVPARVVWLAREHHGRRTANWTDVLRLGDPRDPDPVRQQVFFFYYPERVQLVVGAGAGAGELVAAHQESVEVATLTDFVTRRAHIALEKAERTVRGNRYKVPKFLADEILRRAEFRDGVAHIASDQGIPDDVALRRAQRYLSEIAASHSPFLIDLIASAIHWIYRRGYGAIIYDPAKVAEIAAIGQQHPVAFLPAHRSNLDRLALQYLLWENDLPPNHTAAGINMNFFPVGPLIRRAGAFFIRRSFKDNELYKFVLRSYLDYLIEKRFPLEWYMEGGRSRSGKLLPPRYGMLAWVLDSIRRNRAEDVHLVPTSIIYDQIQDVADYANEASGGEKPKESLVWVLSAIRSLRRRYGNIHIRFAEPISVRKELDDMHPQADDATTIGLQKLAFEVMYRISQVTAITPTSVAAIALLASRGRAASIDELARRCHDLDDYIEKRNLPTTEPLTLEDPLVLGSVLDQLHSHGAVSRSAEGTTFWLQAPQALQVAYYRNTVVHLFVPGSLAELALAGHPSSQGEFWQEVLRLRDILKFEFFFPEKEQFRALVSNDLDLLVPGWETDPGTHVLTQIRPLRAHWAILPFLEAYQVVADELCANLEERPDKAIIQSALARGRRYRHEGLIETDDSVSKILFGSALALARNRGLLEPDSEARQNFAAEIADARARALDIAGIADAH